MPIADRYAMKGTGGGISATSGAKQAMMWAKRLTMAYTVDWNLMGKRRGTLMYPMLKAIVTPIRLRQRKTGIRAGTVLNSM